MTAYRGTAIAEPRYAVDYYTDAFGPENTFLWYNLVTSSKKEFLDDASLNHAPCVKK